MPAQKLAASAVFAARSVSPTRPRSRCTGAIGLKFSAPELREDQGEIEAAGIERTASSVQQKRSNLDPPQAACVAAAENA
jgi:hypothetical protein